MPLRRVPRAAGAGHVPFRERERTRPRQRRSRCAARGPHACYVVASSLDRVWHSNKSANVRSGAVAPSTTRAAASVRATKSTRKAHLPERMRRCLQRWSTKRPPATTGCHEIKYDGYRMMCRIDGGKARLYSRNGKDWTDRFAAVARDLAELPVSERVDRRRGRRRSTHRGRTSFQALQNALASPTARGIAFFAFDVPFLDGYDLRDVALTIASACCATL